MRFVPIKQSAELSAVDCTVGPVSFSLKIHRRIWPQLSRGPNQGSHLTWLPHNLALKCTEPIKWDTQWASTPRFALFPFVRNDPQCHL